MPQTEQPSPIELFTPGFRLSLPPGFRVHSALFLGTEEESAPGGMHDPIVGPPPAFRPTVTFGAGTTLPEELEGYVDEQLQVLRTFQNFKLVERERPAFARGKAVLLHHTFQHETTSVEQLQLYAASLQQSWIVTTTDLAGPAFHRHEP